MTPNNHLTNSSWKQSLRAMAHPRVITMLLLGVSAGIPLLLIFSSLSLWLREAGVDRSAVTYQAVLTTVDKINRTEREAVIEQVKGALTKHPAAFPEIVVTSSEKGEGIESLRAIIATLE